MIHSVRFFINNHLIGDFGQKFLKDIKDTDTLQILLNKIKNSVSNDINGYERIKKFDYSYMPQESRLPAGKFVVKVGMTQEPAPSYETSCTSKTMISSLFSRFKRSVPVSNKDKLVICIPIICKNWD